MAVKIFRVRRHEFLVGGTWHPKGVGAPNSWRR